MSYQAILTQNQENVTVRQSLKKAERKGVELRMSLNQAAIKKRGRPKKNIDSARVLALVAAGKTDHEIAGELDLSVRTLRAFRKEHGISSAIGHGGARRGAGRKKFTSGPYDPYMERQQAIDARVNSVDARLRVGRDCLCGDQWLKWAGSAFEYNRSLGRYVSKIAGFGVPAVVRQRG
ncbi:DNA-binding protein [Desulfoscipio gibsoniae]